MPQRIDDPSIKDEDLLWRRILNVPQWVTQNPAGGYRVSSAVFIDDYTGEVSVHQAKLTTQERALRGRADDGLVEIEAGFPRALGQIVASDPTKDDPSHALICPPPGQSKGQRKANARKMAEAARWLLKPKDIR